VELTAEELAVLYLRQLRASEEEVVLRPKDEPNALFLWEALIVNDPERAWPVFEETLSRVSDDEAIEQIWYRLRLLLYRHFDAFHERASQLLARFPRLAVVAGPDALDPARYAAKTIEREELIEAYRVVHRTHESSREIDRLASDDPERALTLAVEIIHRGLARGWETFDVMSPLADVIANSGPQVIAQVEEQARQSVAVRRALWRLRRHLPHRVPPIDPDVWDRVQRATGTTTDYTELDIPLPPPRRQPDADERAMEAWFAREENFWAFSALGDLCGEEPQLAWSITLDLIARADDEGELGAIAAGPLEDLISKHPDAIWDDLTARAQTDARLREALRGVWVFEDDGPIYQRFRELMESFEAEPN